jgi:hypothetical protein
MYRRLWTISSGGPANGSADEARLVEPASHDGVSPSIELSKRFD